MLSFIISDIRYHNGGVYFLGCLSLSSFQMSIMAANTGSGISDPMGFEVDLFNGVEEVNICR